MSFINMNIQDVVTAIVEAMLPRGSDDKTVLVMSFDMRVNKRDDYERQAVSRMVHLMFHRPDNYTKVLWNVSSGWDNYRRHKVWEIKADHDSCWGSDGVGRPFYQLAQDMMKEINPTIGWLGVDVSIGFHFANSYPKLIKLQSYKEERESRRFTVTYIPET